MIFTVYRRLILKFQRITVPLIFGFCGLLLLTIYATRSATDSSYMWSRVPDHESIGYVKEQPSLQGSPKTLFNRTVRWTYECNNDACIRQEANESVTSFDVCWLTCGSHGSLWPYPKEQQRDSTTVKFLPSNLHLSDIRASSEGVRWLIEQAFQLKKSYFENSKRTKTETRGFLWSLSSRFMSATNAVENIQVKVSIYTNSSELMLTLSTDESYEIRIEKTTESVLSVMINGSTFYGVRHGIETLSQLIAIDQVNDCLQILRSYYARDGPAFRWRGVLIDSARNFVPLSTIKKVIDGMSINKLNILHWHLTDSNSFTFYSKQVPQLSEYGALSEDKVYHPDEIEDLIKYARIRGVKIVPELDAPSHAGNGWQFGEKYGLGKLAYYSNLYDDSWPMICGQPPCGILNPVNPRVYEVLEKVYHDMFEIFDNDVFHQGGDEINLNSWRNIPEIRKRMERKPDITMWKHFQTNAFNRLRNQAKNVTAIIWTSKLTEHELRVPYLKTSDYIIQVWEGFNSENTIHLLKKGFSLIMSFVDKFYLDWGYGTWLGKEHLYTFSSWQNIYDTELFDNKMSKVRRQQILGGEAPLWGEKVGPFEVEIKLWPRAAALAENLWSSPKTRTDETYTRINYHNHRMRQRGIQTSQLQPESCLHYYGHCANPNDRLR